MVYEVQKSILADLKCKLPGLSTIICFTEGCVGQYKNWENFCQYKSDFGLNVRWVFFATSHGKQPCDEIGGTVKWLVSNARLKHDSKDQILYDSILQGKYSEYIFRFILKAEGVTQIPGKRSFHEFSPTDQYSIEMKRTSEDKEPSSVHKFKTQTKQNSVVQVLDYVSCLHDNKWWVGIITNVDDEEEDVQVKFMHPSGPSRSFQWPHVDDICWVPNDHILCKIHIPITSSGRFYSILEHDRKLTKEQFLAVKQ